MIYLDMDGVLTDFDSQYEKLFGPVKHTVTGKERVDNWTKFVKGGNFEKLPMLESAHELLAFVENTGQPVEILTSSGGPQFHEEVKAQKIAWLILHGIRYKANVVPGGMKKAEYASKSSILVDDTERVVNNFKKHGGEAILHVHTRVDHTITKLREFLTHV